MGAELPVRFDLAAAIEALLAELVKRLLECCLSNNFRFHFLPAHCGHHLNPIEGFWRVMKDTIGAGRCFGNLQQLYQRTRRVLMVHQERPIYEFHW